MARIIGYGIGRHLAQALDIDQTKDPVYSITLNVACDQMVTATVTGPILDTRSTRHVREQPVTTDQLRTFAALILAHVGN